MCDETRCPPGYFQFPGLAPDGKGQAFFLLAKDGILGHYRETRNGQKAKEGFLVPEVLQNPAGIWLDLKRPLQNNALCYAGIPSRKFFGNEVQIEARLAVNRTLAVYISPRRAAGGQFIVMGWDAVEVAKGTPGFPVDHAERFGRLLWPPEPPTSTEALSP